MMSRVRTWAKTKARAKVLRVLVPSLLTFSLLASTGIAAQAQALGPCDDIRWRDGTREVAKVIRCAWDRFHPGEGGTKKALDVARCESGLDPRADGGSVEGLFQHQKAYWPERYDLYVASHPRRSEWGLTDSIWSARVQAIVTALMVRREGWSAWSCA